MYRCQEPFLHNLELHPKNHREDRSPRFYYFTTVLLMFYYCFTSALLLLTYWHPQERRHLSSLFLPLEVLFKRLIPDFSPVTSESAVTGRITNGRHNEAENSCTLALHAGVRILTYPDICYI
jgi:hypothetical protein